MGFGHKGEVVGAYLVCGVSIGGNSVTPDNTEVYSQFFHDVPGGSINDDGMGDP